MRGQDVRGCGDLRVLLGQEAPEMAERDQLVTKRDVDVADAGRVRLEIEQRERLERRGHVRHRDEFGDRASWAPAAPARAALRRAREDAQSAQRHVESVLAARAGGNLRQIVVSDLCQARCSLARSARGARRRRLCLERPGSSMGSTRSRCRRQIVRLAPLVIRRQPRDPPLKRHPGQPRPCRDHAPSQHDGARPSHPLCELRPTIVGDPARPDRRARSGPTVLATSDRDTPCQRTTGMAHIRHASAAVRPAEVVKRSISACSSSPSADPRSSGSNPTSTGATGPFMVFPQWAIASLSRLVPVLRSSPRRTAKAYRSRPASRTEGAGLAPHRREPSRPRRRPRACEDRR